MLQITFTVYILKEMKGKYILLALLLQTVLFSCTDKPEMGKLVISEDFTMGSLEGEVKFALPDSLFTAYALDDIGDYLLAMVPDRPYHYYLLDKADLSIVTGLCPQGEGPEEYLSPSVTYNSDENTLTLTERDRSRLSIIDIAASVAQKETVVKAQTSFAKTGKAVFRVFGTRPPFPAYVLEGMTFGLYSLMPDKQLQEADLLLPSVELAESLQSALLYMTQTTHVYSSIKHTLFVTNLYFPRIDLIDTKSRAVRNFYLNSKIEPEKAAEGDRISYVWGIAGTDRYVYVGSTNRPNAMMGDWEQKEIYVFDWEGHPVKRYELPRSGSSFTVDNQDSKLYVLIQNEEETEVYRYDIK